MGKLALNLTEGALNLPVSLSGGVIAYTTAQFIHCYGSRLELLYVLDKHFTNWAACPAPKVFLIVLIVTICLLKLY